MRKLVFSPSEPGGTKPFITDRASAGIMKVLDSHVHFVDPARSEGIVWPDQDSPVYGRRMPEDIFKAYNDSSLAGCIAVETSRRDIDDDWLIQLAGQHPHILGVVLNLRPDASEFSARLRRCRDNARFVGIRLRPIEQYNLEAPLLLKNIEQLQRDGRTIEFGANSVELKASFTRLARRFPETTWILDHCGHPEPGSELPSEWREGIAEIAALQNTACKITSGYCGSDLWAPMLRFLESSFGPDRLMFGSNWPACGPSVQMDEPVAQIGRVFDERSQRVLEMNARRIYRLDSDFAKNDAQQEG